MYVFPVVMGLSSARAIFLGRYHFARIAFPIQALAILGMSKHQATVGAFFLFVSWVLFPMTYASATESTAGLAACCQSPSGKPFHHRGRNMRCSPGACHESFGYQLPIPSHADVTSEIGPPGLLDSQFRPLKL